MRSIFKMTQKVHVIFRERPGYLWEGSFYGIWKVGIKKGNNTESLLCIRSCCEYPICFLLFSAHSLPEVCSHAHFAEVETEAPPQAYAACNYLREEWDRWV